MVTLLSIKKFLSSANNYINNYTIIDVRSPAEFAQGHIPGAHNVPLFSDTERALVGTAYKHQGKQTAIKLGMDIFGPQISSYIERIAQLANNKPLIIYCWRGGMRSKSVCMIATFFGCATMQLAGGYKAFRRFLYDQAEKPYSIVLLGGKTGTGKTEIIKALTNQKKQTLDLEGFANHKGSVFGALGKQTQPTQEQFITNVLLALYSMDRNAPIWIEKESLKIGKLSIPLQLWLQMQQAPVVYIETSITQRIDQLMQDYGSSSPEQLIECVTRITKKLGREQTKKIAEHISNNNYHVAIQEILAYYDKLYDHHTQKEQRAQFYTLSLNSKTADKQAEEILAFWQTVRQTSPQYIGATCTSM